MIAAVLCGGKGTRLRDVIGEHQKCVVDVGGRPWLHRVLDELTRASVEKVVLLTGYHGEEVVTAALDWRCPAAAVPPEIFFLPSKPTGPEAAVQLAFAKTRERALLIVNGDTLILGFDLPRFVRNCTVTGESESVVGPSLLDGKTAPAGIVYRALGSEPVEYQTLCTFLDIGSPEGLAEARRRFG